MSIIQAELDEIKKIAERQIPGSKLETCVHALVRVNIQRTKYKQIVVCFQFPDKYPTEHILVELKSKFIAEKLLEGLTKLAHEEAKKHLGRPQILAVLKFVRSFIDENPLCCCSDEISKVKASVATPTDEIKLRQKTSSLLILSTHNNYKSKLRIVVPENYPDNQVSIEEVSSNYPPVIRRWITGQATEVARRCVEAPRNLKAGTIFVKKPSLLPVLQFVIPALHNSPTLICGVCEKTAMPSNPADNPTDEDAATSVERVYCGHLYHHNCLDIYIKTPPFTGGKKCHSCSKRIYHDKWKLSPAIAEARWANKEARDREIEEAIDFFK